VSSTGTIRPLQIPRNLAELLQRGLQIRPRGLPATLSLRRARQEGFPLCSVPFPVQPAAARQGDRWVLRAGGRTNRVKEADDGSVIGQGVSRYKLCYVF
jgi:hypothetical protein